jgi:hypothetical protein
MTQDLILPPAVYSETHADRLSDKYVHVKTSDVLEIFQDHGWSVREASAARKGNVQHSRHMLRLRHKDYLEGFRVDGIIPELVVLNSHNGSWALRMLLGMFRMVCTNGMVAGTIWDGVTLKHYRLTDAEEKIKLATEQLGTHVGLLADTIETWDKIEMSIPDQIEFAKSASHIRWGEAAPVEEHVLLEARRTVDQGNTLWKVFNRVQESLTQGGFSGRSSNNRTFSVKGIKNVKRDYLYNQRLWSAANDFAQRVAA